jgi:hypothetical protein
MNLKAAKALGLTISESFLLRRLGDRIKWVTAAGHESVIGTKRTSWAGLAKSVHWGRPEVAG